MYTHNIPALFLPGSSLALLVYGLFSAWNGYDSIFVLLVSIVGVVISLFSLTFWYKTLATSDGLNTPEALPTRSILFWKHTSINTIVFILLFII